MFSERRVFLPKKLIYFLLGSSFLGSCHTLSAQSFTWTKADGTETAYDSTVLTSAGRAMENGGILTIYAPEVTTDAQFSGNSVGQEGTFTIQSGTSGTQVTIKTGGSYRFCDYAHGTYILKDLYFKDCGKLNDGGGVFYRNDQTPSTFRMENVTIEGALGNQSAALRAATGMTLSGTAVFRDNIVSEANGAAVQVASGSMTLEGDDTVLTFTGTKNSSGAAAYDLRASAGITFNGAGTYSLDGGMMAQTLVVNGANVTLGSGSKSDFSQTATVEAGKLTLNSANFNAVKLTVDAGAVLDLNAAVTLPMTVNGTVNVGVSDLTFHNLFGSSDTGANAVIQPAAGLENASVTFQATGGDLTFYGTVTGFKTVKKTGESIMSFRKSIDADTFIITGGTLNFDSATDTIATIDADVYVNGNGRLRFYGNAKSGVSVLGNGALYVGADGGELALDTGRGYLTVHSEEGVQSGNLILNGSRGFIVGESTFNGFYEITHGTTHFSNESLAKSKGIILNGGTLQYAGEIAANRELTAPIFLKNASSLQCGWGGTFSLSGAISDFEGADLTGKYLTVNGDSGYVDLNGSVNTKAIFRLNDNARTNGANDVTFGGLQNGSGKTFTTTASSDTGKKLILNVASSTAPIYSGTLSGNLNLVKEGDGTQTFQTVGIGTESAPLASVTVNDGTLKMNGVPIYAKELVINEDGVLAFSSGTHLIDADSITVNGAMDILIGAAGASTKLNVPTSAEDFTADLEDGIFNVVAEDGYLPEQFISWQIADVFPDFGTGYDYDLFLGNDFRDTWNLSWSNGGLFLSIDNNAGPEPGSWLLLLLGGFGIYRLSTGKKNP
ncbi:MAG: hypothetical protein Q4D17_01940 [Planctomycetia bacterium]|nr:hypothetical protein [Planctomycetia bacterium]